MLRLGRVIHDGRSGSRASFSNLILAHCPSRMLPHSSLPKAAAPAAGKKLSAKEDSEDRIAQVSKQFDRWNAALATLEPKQVAQL